MSFHNLITNNLAQHSLIPPFPSSPYRFMLHRQPIRSRSARIRRSPPANLLGHRLGLPLHGVPPKAVIFRASGQQPPRPHQRNGKIPVHLFRSELSPAGHHILRVCLSGELAQCAPSIAGTGHVDEGPHLAVHPASGDRTAGRSFGLRVGCGSSNSRSVPE